MTKAEDRASQATGVDVELLKSLRHHRSKKRLKPGLPEIDAAATPGQRMADWVAAQVGSWRFILVQSTLLVLWIAINSMAWIKGWDPYPFILLNLVLSFQAAYTAPIIMMSQNRLAMVDRQHAEDDYHINVKAELEIELLHQKVDMMREQEMAKLIELVARLEQRLAAAEKPSTPTAKA